MHPFSKIKVHRTRLREKEGIQINKRAKSSGKGVKTSSKIRMPRWWARVREGARAEREREREREGGGVRTSVKAIAGVGRVTDSDVTPPPPGALEVLGEVAEFAGQELIRRCGDPFVIAVARWDWEAVPRGVRPRSKC